MAKSGRGCPSRPSLPVPNKRRRGEAPNRPRPWRRCRPGAPAAARPPPRNHWPPRCAAAGDGDAVRDSSAGDRGAVTTSAPPPASARPTNVAPCPRGASRSAPASTSCRISCTMPRSVAARASSIFSWVIPAGGRRVRGGERRALPTALPDSCLHPRADPSLPAPHRRGEAHPAPPWRSQCSRGSCRPHTGHRACSHPS